MPPPSPPVDGPLSCLGSRSLKRPHSSHMSTAAARGGSSHLSTAERRSASSDSGSSSSSLHQEIRVKKRRIFERFCSGSSQRGFIDIGDDTDRDRRVEDDIYVD